MSFPESIPEREAYILDRVRKGKYGAKWKPISSSYNGHTGRFWVMQDALTVDGVRVNVSANLEQQIADVIGASLLTAKLADLIHAQADVVLEPQPRPITSSTQAMLEQDALLTKLIGKKRGLVSTVGKHWIIDERLSWYPTKAVNYGWHFVGTTYKGIQGYPAASTTAYSVIQPVSTAHDKMHVDYSQMCVLVLKACMVDGFLSSLDEVLKDEKLAGLASYTGVLPVLRQTGVPVPANQEVVLPEVEIKA